MSHEKYYCYKCDILFAKEYTLKRHLSKKVCERFILNNRINPEWKCQYCCKTFVSKSKLERHLLSSKGYCYNIRKNKKQNDKKHIKENDTKDDFVVIKIPRRKKINQNKRIKIAASQRWRCNHCDMLFNEGGWDINHKLRVALGGSNDIENLEALCKNCHGVVTANERIKDGF